MLKKTFFSILAVIMMTASSVQSYNNDASAVIIPAMVATVAVTSGLIYATYRESNSSKIARSQEFIAACEGKIHFHLENIRSTSDLVNFVRQPLHVRTEMMYWHKSAIQLKRELEARYAWLKPWNWSLELKKAVENINLIQTKLSFLNMVWKYAPCFKDGLDEQFVVKGARMVTSGGSRYPIMDMVRILEQDIAVVRSNLLLLACGYTLVDALEQVRATLIGSAVYAIEMQEYEKFMQEERKLAVQAAAVQAQQTQAAAQFAQADAMRRQAEAQEQQAQAQQQMARRL